jgi:hypothetical protein
MKTFHLLNKATHIAATTFEFKDIEDNSYLFMRIYKDSKWHDAWAALNEGDKFTLDKWKPVEIVRAEFKDHLHTLPIEDNKVNSLIDKINNLKDVSPVNYGDDIINQYDIKPAPNVNE